MNKFTKIGAAVLGASLSLAATAVPFNVQIEVNSIIGNTPLTVTERSVLAFPVITVDESTTEGTVCVANGSGGINRYINGSNGNSGVHNSSTSLCAGATVAPSSVRVTGTPNALVTVNVETAEQNQGGFEFTGTNTSLSKRLNGSGNYDTGLAATLRLISKSSVTSGLLTFSYDVTAAYQ